MTLTSGMKLGPYEVVALIGAGGMGEVYRARDARLGRDVALKVLSESFARDPERLRRFEQEARAVAALNHPNILGLYDIGSQNGSPYLVSEFLEGQSLRDMLRFGPVPARKAGDYAVQIASGLAAAHEKGIVHRDLKPENLFITKDGRAKILDFGLAKLTQASAPAPAGSEGLTVTSSPTVAGVVMGTAGYMSPEQVRGESVDHRTDIFAFGAVLYEMISGQRAFHRETGAETMTAILKEDPPDLADGTKLVSPALDRIVRRCLEKSAEQRFQSAQDLAFALGALSGTDASGAARAKRGASRHSVMGLVGCSCGAVGYFGRGVGRVPRRARRPSHAICVAGSGRSQPGGAFGRRPDAGLRLARRQTLVCRRCTYSASVRLPQSNCRERKARAFPSGRRMMPTSGSSPKASSRRWRHPADRPKSLPLPVWRAGERGERRTSLFTLPNRRADSTASMPMAAGPRR